MTSPHHRPRAERALHPRDALFGIAAALIIIAVAMICQLIHASTAHASTWQTARATWYGPGFYGNSTACGQRYDLQHRGVAVPSSGPRHMPCGTRLTICRHGRCVSVKVTDTGSFRDHQFDLAARTAMDLCRCSRPYTMSVRWRRGWLHPLAARA